jgi:hypothetical protein
MNPELPFLAAGAVSIIGGTKKQGKFPSNGLTSVMGTVALVIVASATASTRIAPLVHAIGLLLLMTALFAASKDFRVTPKKA